MAKYRLHTELEMRTRKHPFPAAAAELLTRSHTRQLSSAQTPAACPDNQANNYSIKR